MELLTAINERHSIRSFEEKKVPEELLLKLADAAQKAPSASNLQAWRFLFVTDEEKREKVDFFSPGLSGRPPVMCHPLVPFLSHFLLQHLHPLCTS